MSYKWHIHKPLPDYGSPKKLIAKIPMKNLVSDEEHGLWSYHFVDGRIDWIFECWIFTDR